MFQLIKYSVKYHKTKQKRNSNNNKHKEINKETVEQKYRIKKNITVATIVTLNAQTYIQSRANYSLQDDLNRRYYLTISDTIRQ